ncbi:hypothetical protein [Dyadobacter sp. NIV53]|uniref:hypothetical protein n=1 Tax=Dyadobacter sp. NIV53 TaxID=2861765 RepID=UPI001C846D61|nr:hypothetical protein [Dyadobacter sp. NIV53]
MKTFLPLAKAYFLAFFLLFILVQTGYGQTVRKPDVIILKNNTKLEVSIQEVEESAIKYKKLNDSEGPLFSIKKTEIASILYGNGDVSTFPDASSDVFFKQENVSKPFELNPQPAPRNAFEQTIYAYNPNQLRKAYQFYRSKSKHGLVLGIVSSIVGTVAMGVGSAIIVNNNDFYSNGYSSYNDNSDAGAILLIGGLVGGVTFGTIGFVKAGKNGSKASRIRKELIRRREPLAFSIKPGYNTATQSGYLSLKINF